MRVTLSWPLLCTALLAACAPSEREMRDPVHELVRARLSEALAVRDADASDADVAARVDTLLAHELTREGAVQVALLLNPQLLAAYEQLGIASGDVLRASLPANPTLSGSVLIPLGTRTPDIELAVEQDVLGFVLLPLRHGVAARNLDAARARTAAIVVETAAAARGQLARAVAASEVQALRKTVAAAMEASFAYASRLHDAGNLRALEVLRAEAGYRDALWALQSAEQDAAVERARLAAVLGVFGARVDFTLPEHLDDAPLAHVALGHLERTAVERSFALQALHAQLDAAAQQLGYASAARFLPSLDVGVGAERDHGELKVGPRVSIGIPLFDLGQGEVLSLEARTREVAALWKAAAIDLRARAREAQTTAESTAARAKYLHDVVLPLRARLTDETVRQYNAMQLDTFAVLDARRRESEAAVTYVSTLRDAWLARTDVELLQQGGNPAATGAPTASRSQSLRAPAAEGGVDGH